MCGHRRSGLVPKRPSGAMGDSIGIGQPQWRFGSHRTSLRATGARDLSQAVQNCGPAGGVAGSSASALTAAEAPLLFLNAFDGRILMKAVRFHNRCSGVLRYEDAQSPPNRLGEFSSECMRRGLNPPD